MWVAHVEMSLHWRDAEFCLAHVGGYSKSEFKFVKFHIALHCPRQIRMYGSLLIMDSGRWEETHAHFAKAVYKQTSRRHANLLLEMTKKLQYGLKVEHALRAHSIRPYLYRPDRSGAMEPEEAYREGECWKPGCKAVHIDVTSAANLRRFGLPNGQATAVGPHAAHATHTTHATPHATHTTPHATIAM